VSTVFADQAVKVREEGNLKAEHIARGVGVGESTARAWLSRRREPTGERAERLVELVSIVERLGRVMDPEYIPVWMLKPIPALGDAKPLDVIARGDARAVLRLVAALESPVAA
jgi:transcriptional regulator with XRE-family HTH domain